MRYNCKFRVSTLVDCRHHVNRHRHFNEEWLSLQTTSKCFSWARNDRIHVRCITRINSTGDTALSHRQRLLQNTGSLHRSYQTNTAGFKKPDYPPLNLLFKPPSLRSSSTVSGDQPQSWNERVKEFLARSLAFCKTADSQSATEVHPTQYLSRKLSPTEMAETIEALLHDLLEITAKAHAIQKEEFPKNVSHNRTKQTNNIEHLNWISLSSHSSPNQDNTESSQFHTIVAKTKGEDVEVDLAFALIDRLVILEQDDESALMHHTLNWTAHTKCLNPILQLWKQCYSPSSKAGSELQMMPFSALTPSEVLAKLDIYRQNSSLLLPDVQSYNLILDAVATHNNSTSFNQKKGIPLKGENVVDIDFCQSLWEWMWKESNHDSLIRPDEITLRIMFKANIFTGHALAAQRCEALMDEWVEYHSDQLNGSDKSKEYGIDKKVVNDPRGGILQSLIHVWALHDPQTAESYLKELARRYLSGESYNPPDTIAWNRVISAYAISYHQPEKAHELLEDFWNFYRHAHGLDDTSSSRMATLINNGNTVDSDSISTKSNSLKLSNLIAISHTEEGPGMTENSSSAIDSAIWKVHQPNLYTYNILLEGYVRQNNVRMANRIFEIVQNAASIAPDIATYTSAIKANERDLKKVSNIVLQCLEAHKTLRREQKRLDAEDSDDLIPKPIILDRPFFHAWLNACSNAQNVKEAKRVIKQMKTSKITPNTTTYRILMKVFLSRNDSQGAIEWLLAYAKLEGMSENAIVSCTTDLLDWYRSHDHSLSSGNVDTMVLLQILCENGFLTQEESLQQLLLGISPNQGRAVLGWLRRKKVDSLKMWAIVLRAVAQEGTDPNDVEDLFRQLHDDPSLAEKLDHNHATSAFDEEGEKLIIEMYSSLVVAWCKQNKINRRVKRRLQYWRNELSKYGNGELSLNIAAQVALVTLYCEAGDPLSCEEYVSDLYRSFEEGKIDSPPDTIMCNMVLNAWAKKGNGFRAAAFFEDRITEPDTVSYNTVINAFAREGKLEEAEQWAYKLIDSYIESPVESRRPHQATFTVILAAWRRSKDPKAAERAERILKYMHQLYDNSVLLSKPNLKSYQTVLDAWEKSSRIDAAQKAEDLLFSSSDFNTNTRLLEKVRYIKSVHGKRNRRIREGK